MDFKITSASGAMRLSLQRPRPALEHRPLFGLYSLPNGHVTVRTVFFEEQR